MILEHRFVVRVTQPTSDKHFAVVQSERTDSEVLIAHKTSPRFLRVICVYHVLEMAVLLGIMAGILNPAFVLFQ